MHISGNLDKFFVFFPLLQAFTSEGDHLFCKPTFRYYSSEMSAARFLTSEVEGEIQSQQGMVQRLDEEVTFFCFKL